MWLASEHSVKVSLVAFLGRPKFCLHWLAHGVHLVQKSTADVLRLRPFRHVIWYIAGQAFNGWSRWLTRKYQAEWGRALQSVYHDIVYVCQPLHILVPVGVVLCRTVSEVCNAGSVDPFLFSVGLWMIGWCGQVLNSPAHRYGSEELRFELRFVAGQ